MCWCWFSITSCPMVGRCSGWWRNWYNFTPHTAKGRACNCRRCRFSTLTTPCGNATGWTRARKRANWRTGARYWAVSRVCWSCPSTTHVRPCRAIVAHACLSSWRRHWPMTKALAQQQGVTLFMLLLASFQTLLHRYSGQEEIRVGVPIANRNRSETERLIGFFVNTQVLKADLHGQMSVEQLLQHTRQRALDAQAHQDLPFEQLVEALQPERSLSHNPLFQVMFNHQTDVGQAQVQHQLPQLRVEGLDWESKTAHFDLDLDIQESNKGIWATLGYAQDLFEAGTVQRMARHWQNLLQGMVANPQQSLSQLPLLDSAEQQQILHLWNCADSGFSAKRLVHELVADRARENQNAVAVKFDLQTLTYGELDGQANRLAHALIARGVGPEVRVAIAMPRSAEIMVAFLAVMKSGGVYVPLDVEYPRDRLLYMMQDSRAKLLLTHSAVQQRLPIPEGLEVLAVDQAAAWAEVDDTDPRVALDGDNLAYVIYTSGSTGMPKGVAVSHGPLVAHIIATGERYETSPADCELHF